MERDDPRRAQPPANVPDEVHDAEIGERGEERADVSESSGYITTKQAAKALGVSRRTVQSYVRRGQLEAVVEGEGVGKTFYVSIDSLNTLRERRRLSGEGTSVVAGSAPRGSPYSGISANTQHYVGEDTPNLIEVVQDLQYRLGRAEAKVELTERTESTLREQLAREQARADGLAAELSEVRSAPTKLDRSPETAPRQLSQDELPKRPSEGHAAVVSVGSHSVIYAARRPLIEPKASLPWWQYALAIILSAILYTYDYLSSGPLPTIPLLNLAPLFAGVWIGLRRPGAPTFLFAINAILVGLASSTAIVLLVFLSGTLPSRPFSFTDVFLILLQFIGPTLLFGSGQYLGSLFQAW